MGRGWLESLPPRVARAFAPAAISNFFSVHLDQESKSSYARSGATGGGYILSKGVLSEATPATPGHIEVIVDGDPRLRATTTTKALELLLHHHQAPSGVSVEQTMQVPVGAGFGASAAAAVSAVYAAASALGIRASKEELAYHAHVAEILQRTGLGTVSVIYDAVGAGAITAPGGPGVSKFLHVSVPAGTRLVTAFLGPFKKSRALSDPRLVRTINRLGDEALRRVLSNPTLDQLATEGDRFSQALGLMTPGVKNLVDLARKTGAAHASQNMIGYSVHAAVRKEEAAKLARAFRASRLHPRVDTFEIGRTRAGVLSGRAPSRPR